VPIKELREDKLTELDLHGKGLGPAEGIVIAKLVAVTAVITSLDLSGNWLCGVDRIGRGTYDATGIQALAATLAGC